MFKVPMLFRDWWNDEDLLKSSNLKREQSNSNIADKDAFHVVVDVQQFAPSEIAVKVSNNNVIVECKHEEKEDEHGYISRDFSRRIVIPDTHDIDKVVSTLSSDGILTITAPKKGAKVDDKTERTVPITQTAASTEPEQ